MCACVCNRENSFKGHLLSMAENAGNGGNGGSSLHHSSSASKSLKFLSFFSRVWKTNNLLWRRLSQFFIRKVMKDGLERSVSIHQSLKGFKLFKVHLEIKDFSEIDLEI